MDLVAIIEQAKALLQSKRRRTYRVLRRHVTLDEESSEEQKEQFVEAEALAVDQDGKMLVWGGASSVPHIEF